MPQSFKAGCSRRGKDNLRDTVLRTFQHRLLPDWLIGRNEESLKRLPVHFDPVLHVPERSCPVLPCAILHSQPALKIDKRPRTLRAKFIPL